MRWKHYFVCTIVWPLLVANAVANDSIDSQFRQLEKDIPSLYLINGLYLSAEQNDALADLMRRAGRIQKTRTAEVKKWTRRSQQNSSMRVIPKHNGRWSVAQREGVRRFKDYRRQYADELDEVAQEVYDILTPAQRDIVDSFTPCFIPPSDFRNPVRVGQADNHSSFGDPILEYLRNVPDDQVGTARSRAVMRIVPYVMQRSHTRYTEETETRIRREVEQALDEELPRIRELSDVDYELEKAEILTNVLPVDAFRSTSRTQPEEQIWKIRTFMLNPGCLDVVASRGTRPVTGSEIFANTSSDPRDSKGPAGEFRIHRLIRQLDLAPRQIDSILPVLQAGTATRSTLETEIVSGKKRAIPAYLTLREELASDTPTRETERLCIAYHHRVKVFYENELVAVIRPYEQQLDKLLSADQVAQLCIDSSPAPREHTQPRGFMHNCRGAAKRLLREARAMGTSEFKRQKKFLAEDFVRGCSAEGIDIQSESCRAAEILESARDMSHSMFRKQEDDLALALSPRRSSPRATPYGARYTRGVPDPVLNGSSYLLFSDRAVEIITGMSRND